MKREKKILIATSEAVPFAKTGGLADVAGTLPGALEKMGADVTLVMPKYGTIDSKKFNLKKAGSTFKIPHAGDIVEVSLKKADIPGAKGTAYFIECDKYFNRNGLYQENGHDYPDNAERFSFFSKAVIEMLKVIKLQPDVIHCNDWQTGLIPVYLKALYHTDPYYSNIASVITIHNIAYQGNFPSYAMNQIGLPWDLFNPDGVEFFGNVSFLKSGIVFADVINTVSPTYAKEIQSSDEFGKGLQGLLSYRSADLYGILNGIDYDIWNPSKDKVIPSTYNPDDLRGKNRCKKALQKEFNLPESNSPVIGITSRLADQKGFDIIAGAINTLMQMDMQLVILGTGDPGYEHMLAQMEQVFPDKIGVALKFDDALAHRIYAGSDMFLMPSKYEPCGLGQLIALKYGTLPIATKTGGLADTVFDYNESPAVGNGFLLPYYGPDALVDAVDRAIDTFSNKRKWNSIVKKAMLMDFSWNASAYKYIELYDKALQKHTPLFRKG